MIKSIKKLFTASKKSTKANNSKREILYQKNILNSIFSLPIYQEWLDNEKIDNITRDATVIAAMGSRKANILKKEIQITCENTNIKELLEECFPFKVCDAMLDIPYYGFGVFEINWALKNGFITPLLVERPYKDFLLVDGVLKYNEFGASQDINAHKAIYATYKTKPNKPYGQPLLHTLFWLIEFKNASLEFWVQLLERFGTPWIIAKTEGSKEDFAKEIYNMLGGDGAVIEGEDDIRVESVKNGGNFKEIVEYIDNQIREVILGGNLTANVSSGSFAAASVHNAVREDLASADENIVNELIKEVIKSFKELNNLSNLEIKGILKDKDDENTHLAARDKIIYDMGYQPTLEYIETTYNIKVTALENKSFLNHQIPKALYKSKLLSANSIVLNKALPSDEIDVGVEKIDFSKQVLTFQKQIMEIVDKSNSYEEVLDNLLTAYPTFDTKELEEELFKYLSATGLLGVAEIEEDNPNG